MRICQCVAVRRQPLSLPASRATATYRRPLPLATHGGVIAVPSPWSADMNVSSSPSTDSAGDAAPTTDVRLGMFVACPMIFTREMSVHAEICSHERASDCKEQP